MAEASASSEAPAAVAPPPPPLKRQLSSQVSDLAIAKKIDDQQKDTLKMLLRADGGAGKWAIARWSLLLSYKTHSLPYAFCFGNFQKKIPVPLEQRKKLLQNLKAEMN